MKEIIVIRHGEKDGDELTPEGVVACNALAGHVGTIKYAYASETHRATQTAELVSQLPVATDSRANIPAFPSEVRDRLMESQRIHTLGIVGGIWEDSVLIQAARDAGIKMQSMINDILCQLNDGERALIVSHDGTMIGLEKVLKNESFENVDHSFGSLEGFSIGPDLAVHPFKI